MPAYRVLIFLSPVQGHEAEFHEWYEHTHLDDVLATAGFSAAQRFGYEAGLGSENPNSHLAIYETEGESADEVLERLNSSRDQRDMTGAASADASQMAVWVFSVLGDRHVLEAVDG